MTRSSTLIKLLEHGPLTRQEMEEITGWPKQRLFIVLRYLAREDKIECVNRKHWRLHEGLRSPRMDSSAQAQA